MISAYKGEAAVISGGIPLSISGWVPYQVDKAESIQLVQGNNSMSPSQSLLLNFKSTNVWLDLKPTPALYGLLLVGYIDASNIDQISW